MKIARLLLGAFASLLILSSVPSYAQITISSMPLSASDFFVDTLSVSSVPSLTAGGGQTWNISGTIAAQHNEQFYSSTDPNFSASAIYDTIGFEPLVKQGSAVYGIEYHQVFDASANAIINPGIVLPAQAYSLAGITTVSTDSLWVSTQDALYSTPINYLALPATAETNWSISNSRRSIDMQIRIGALKAFNYYGITDFKKVSYFTTTDTVVGWGTLTIPVPGGTSAATPILMLKAKTIKVDSFYLNDSVPNYFILTKFGLGEGTVTTSYSYRFMAQSSVLPLFAVDYSDPNYSQATASYSYPAAASGVTATEPSPTGIHLFPNPSHSRAFYVQLDRALGPGDRIQIADLSGNRIEAAQTSTAVNGTVVSVSLPAETAAGTYFIRVIRTSGAPEQSKIEIAP